MLYIAMKVNRNIWIDVQFRVTVAGKGRWKIWESGQG